MLGAELRTYRIQVLRERWKRKSPDEKVDVIFPQLKKYLYKLRDSLIYIEIVGDTSFYPRPDRITIGPLYVPKEDKKIEWLYENMSAYIIACLEERNTMYKLEFDFHGISKVYSPHLTISQLRVAYTDDPYYIERIYEKELFIKEPTRR